MLFTKPKRAAITAIMLEDYIKSVRAYETGIKNNQDTKSIDSGLHESLKFSAYIHRLSEAVTDLTSPSPEPVQRFERHLVSAQLHAACGLKFTIADTVRLSEAFSAVKEPLLQNSFARLEGALARVNRACTFVSQSLSKVVQGHEQEAEQAQRQGFNKQQMQEAQPTKEISNFMEEIR